MYSYSDYDTTGWRLFNWNSLPVLMPPAGTMIPCAFIFDQVPPRAVVRSDIENDPVSLEVDNTTWQALIGTSDNPDTQAVEGEAERPH